MSGRYTELDELSMLLKPSDVELPSTELGCFVGVYGSIEVQVIAAVVVRWHHIHSSELWRPMVLGAFARWYREDPWCSECRNNLAWLLAFTRGLDDFVCAGLVVGWVPFELYSIGRVTENLVGPLLESPYNRRDRVWTD